ncbi:MAG: type II toxin-antitoxin system RelE/ParE family toxin [Chloroflexota bacterium]|nr:MAG: type II toxin-antitoxin system RelE/ParE family toxin [Chloroflexota bacterium]
MPPFQVHFYKTAAGNEPVREWLLSLSGQEKKTIGEDIKTVQFGWPIGMPVSRKVAKDLWEIRSSLQNKIARVVFTVKGSEIILLHGFVKKTEKLPGKDLEIAKRRLADLRG